MTKAFKAVQHVLLAHGHFHLQGEAVVSLPDSETDLPGVSLDRDGGRKLVVLDKSTDIDVEAHDSFDVRPTTRCCSHEPYDLVVTNAADARRVEVCVDVRTLRTSPRQPESTRRRLAKMMSECRVSLVFGPEMTRTPANLQVSRGPSVRL